MTKVVVRNGDVDGALRKLGQKAARDGRSKRDLMKKRYMQTNHEKKMEAEKQGKINASKKNRDDR